MTPLIVAFLLLMLLGSLALTVSMPLGNAQQSTTSKPSVPEFTLRFVDKSYDVPPTTISTTNQYNNKTTTTTFPGHHVKNFTIELIIKNQPFPSTINGNASNLYYNVRTKGHFGEGWAYQYSSFPAWISNYSSASNGSVWGDYSDALPIQSSTEYTISSFPANYQPGDKVDFQVEAILGVQHTSYNYRELIPTPENYFMFNSSGWSPTQTFTMPETSPVVTPIQSTSTAPILTPTSTVPEFSVWVILPLAIVMAIMVATIIRKKKLKQSS